jgi:5-methylcytosine-specific restriction endonuclease McrA
MNKVIEARRLLKKLDTGWADEVKERDGYRCAICGSTMRPNAHHIIPRENKLLRHNLHNGITLCPKHHKFSYEFSAHKNSFAFIRWLRANRKEQFKFLEETFIIDE